MNDVLNADVVIVGSGVAGAITGYSLARTGTRVLILEAGPRIVPTEDGEVSAAVAEALRKSGMIVRENFGAIESFEKTPTGVRMNFSKDGQQDCAEATLAVVAVGWVADLAALNLPAASVEVDRSSTSTSSRGRSKRKMRWASRDRRTRIGDRPGPRAIRCRWSRRPISIR